MDTPDQNLLFEQLMELWDTNEINLKEIFEKNKTESVNVSDTIKLIIKGDYYKNIVKVTIIEEGKPSQVVDVSMVYFYMRIGQWDPRPSN